MSIDLHQELRALRRCPATRREFLARAGGGLGLLRAGGPALRARMRRPTTRRPGDPLAPRPPHFAPKANSVIWLFMEGRAERRGPVRPQAGARQESRQEDRDRRLQRQSGPADEVAVRVPAVRRVGRLGLREVPERREARRRHRVRQVVLHRVERPRARALPDEHGRLPARACRPRAPGSPTAWGARTGTCPGSSCSGTRRASRAGR